MNKERVQRLEQLGFVWNQKIAEVDFRFEQLKAFKERFGHCNVTRGWKEDPALAQWCSTQRLYRNKGLLSKERIQRLNQLGFVWDSCRAQTDLRFEQLKAFKERFGHCNVVRGWKENPALARWVNTQRVYRKKGLLSEEQVQRLDQLGFVWSLTSVGETKRTPAL